MSKVTKGAVVDADRDGTPHITIERNEQGGLSVHHYAAGCPCRHHGSPSSGNGPAKVASDAYRSGWDAIDGGSRGGSA